MSLIANAVQISLSWIEACDGKVPKNAIDAGGSTYIVRASHKNDLLIGYLHESSEFAKVPWNGKAVAVREYEVLCNTSIDIFGLPYQWLNGFGGQVPPLSVIGGHTFDRQALYVARCHIDGQVVVGQVRPSHGGAYFPIDDKESRRTSYEVLGVRRH